MSQRRRIAVLCHRNQDFAPGYYLSRVVSDHWAKSGIEVVVHHGLDNPPDADLAILHLDASEPLPDYDRLARSYPRSINANVGSLAKSKISSLILSRDDTYAGPVIVKTDLNSYGWPEYNLLRRQAKSGFNPMTYLKYRYERHLRPRLRSLPNREYTVFDALSSVPSWIWRDRRYVVEAYKPQFDGEFYHVNYWFFLGDADFVFSVWKPAFVVRAYLEEQCSPPHSHVPEEVRRVRQALRLDFGKLDYLMHDGRAEVIDASRTPNAGERIALPQRGEICQKLAAGLESYFKD